MRTYFRGWKRKFGAMMLVLASIFSASWIRSIDIEDILGTPSNEHGSDFLISVHGEFTWVRFDDIQPSIIKAIPGWKSQRQIDLRPFWGEDVTLWRMRFIGIDMRRQEWWGRGPHALTAITVPYWLIAVPLTLISAWCLLSKPRSKPARIPN
jgi:hypothetical protein